MPFHIRPFTTDDYAVILAVSRVIYPDYAATEDELRYWDDHRDLALKLCGIAYAREHGGTSIKTWNDSPNTAMISINQQLGFVRKVGWIIFLKDFEQESQGDRKSFA